MKVPRQNNTFSGLPLLEHRVYIRRGCYLFPNTTMFGRIWDWLHRIVEHFWGCKGTLLLLGLDGAGKTTLLGRLKDDRMVQPLPTWMPHSESLQCGCVTFTTYDIGGHKQVRRVWKDYFPVADGILYIIDGYDRDRFLESKVELDRILMDEEMSEIPIAVMVNKIDIHGAANDVDVARYFNLAGNTTGQDTSIELQGRRPIAIFPCSVKMRQGYGNALKWLAHYMRESRRNTPP